MYLLTFLGFFMSFINFESREFVSVHPVFRIVGSLYHLTRDFFSLVAFLYLMLIDKWKKNIYGNSLIKRIS